MVKRNLEVGIGQASRRQVTGGTHPRQGRAFAARIRPARGLSPSLESVFECALEGYLQERELINDGTPLHLLVRSAERELAATDQMDLVDWLFRDLAVQSVDLGPLGPASQSAADAAVWITATRSDLALPAVLTLYRLCRIDGQTALCVLRGFGGSGGL